MCPQAGCQAQARAPSLWGLRKASQSSEAQSGDNWGEKANRNGTCNGLVMMSNSPITETLLSACHCLTA